MNIREEEVNESFSAQGFHEWHPVPSSFQINSHLLDSLRGVTLLSRHSKAIPCETDCGSYVICCPCPSQHIRRHYWCNFLLLTIGSSTMSNCQYYPDTTNSVISPRCQTADREESRGKRTDAFRLDIFRFLYRRARAGSGALVGDIRLLFSQPFQLITSRAQGDCRYSYSPWISK